MRCISLNFKHADAAFRQHFAFPEETQRAMLRRLCQAAGEGCVLLCTCNRTEVYTCGIPDETVSALLAEVGGIPAGELLPHLRIYPEEQAPRHLFRVASGLHSMVLGEDEILRQTKAAYQTACQEGTVGYELHRTFQAAITCAKRIKTETPLSATPVSIATLAAHEARSAGGRVLVIGATGQIGTACVKNLLSLGVQVTATLRQHGAAFELRDSRLQTADYHKRYTRMEDADCVISATRSPHFTVTAHGLQGLSSVPKLFLDLALPPDIDPEIGKIPGTALLTLDDFERLSRENHTIRQDSAEAAGAMIAEALEDLRRELIFHAFLPEMTAVCQRLREAPEQMLYQLRDRLSPQALEDVLHILEE